MDSTSIDGDAVENVTIVVCDLASPITPITAKLFGPVDLILNFASDTHPPRSVTHPVEFVQNNVNLALYLLEYARSLNPYPVFVQISTNSVYGPAEGVTSHPEWDAIVPNNPYGASKAAQEALAISYWRSYHMPVIIAATMNPMGETQDTEKFIPNAIGKILRGEQVQIHANAFGEVGMRTYIDADDMIGGLLHVLSLGAPAMPSVEVTRPDRWNIAGVREVDNYTVATVIAEALDRPLRTDVVAVDRPEHGHRYSLDPFKLRDAGWQASPDTLGAIRRTARWTAENPLWVN